MDVVTIGYIAYKVWKWFTKKGESSESCEGCEGHNADDMTQTNNEFEDTVDDIVHALI